MKNNEVLAEEAEELQNLMEQDYDIGSIIREKIIPHAVSCFTGEAARDEYDDIEEEDDDLDEKDDEDEDEKEEEDQDDEEKDEKTTRKKSSAARETYRRVEGRLLAMHNKVRGLPNANNSSC